MQQNSLVMQLLIIEEQFEKDRNMRLDVERYRSMADKTMFDRVHIGEWFILNDEIQSCAHNLLKKTKQ